MSEIAVIGAGAWGTAISIVLGRKQTHNVRLWAHEPEVCESIAARRVNEMFLPGPTIPETVTATNSLETALRNAEIVVSVMPSHHTRRVFRAMLPHLRPEMLFAPSAYGGATAARYVRTPTQRKICERVHIMSYGKREGVVRYADKFIRWRVPGARRPALWQ